MSPAFAGAGLVGKPVSTLAYARACFSGTCVLSDACLVGKPVSTFPGHALEVGLGGGRRVDRCGGPAAVEYQADETVVLGANLFLENGRPGAETHARRPGHGEGVRIVDRELHFESAMI